MDSVAARTMREAVGDVGAIKGSVGGKS